MPSIPFGLQSYRRNHGNLPEWTLINFFAEESPTADKGVVLLSRGGLTEVSTVGSGPIRAVFSQEGTFGGDVFTVSGSSVYRGSTLLGTLTINGPVSIAGSAAEVVFAAGGTAKSYNGSNFASVSFPDGASVTAVAYVSQLFVYLRASTGRFYWSAINDGRTLDGVDFANAETAPDNLIDIQRYRGNMYLMGAATIEPWFPTADPDLPFSRINQDVYDVGVLDTGCSAILDNALYFVGNDGVVYRGEEVPRRVSDYAIEERIFDSADISAFWFGFENHKFFVVNYDDGTHALDVATGQWTQFKSFDLERFRISCAAMVGRTALLGDYEDGTLWEMDADATQDAGDSLEGTLTAGLPIKGGTVIVDRITLEINSGQTAIEDGEDALPTAEMRYSRDAGNTWSDWRLTSMGGKFEYRTRVTWRRLGTFDPVGAMFQFRFVDDAPRRVSDVLINEPGGGRGRP